MTHWWLSAWREVMVGHGVERPPAIVGLGTLLVVVVASLPPRGAPRGSADARGGTGSRRAQLRFDCFMAMGVLVLAAVHHYFDPTIAL